MIKWGHMNVYTFYLKHNQSKVFFFVLNFLLYSSFTSPSPNVKNEEFLIKQTWRSIQEGKSLEQRNQCLTFTFQWKLNKQRCNCERMRDKDVKFIHIISIVTVVYNNGINLKILMSHWRHLTTTFKLPHAQRRWTTSKFISDYPPKISTSPHQSDLAPYVSRSYNARWNAPELLHDKHMLHLSCILRKIEVEEPWIGLWLPLHYWVDIGVS